MLPEDFFHQCGLVFAAQSVRIGLIQNIGDVLPLAYAFKAVVPPVGKHAQVQVSADVSKVAAALCNQVLRRKNSAGVVIGGNEGDLFGNLPVQRNNGQTDRFKIANVQRMTTHDDAVHLMAAEVLKNCLKHGRKIPEEIKIVGYDDTDLTRYFYPSITSVAQPIESIAKYTVDYLIAEVMGEVVPNQTILEVSLSERETT